MTEFIKSFDYRKGKKNGGKEALRQVGYLMREIEDDNDYSDYEDSWEKLEEKIAEALSED